MSLVMKKIYFKTQVRVVKPYQLGLLYTYKSKTSLTYDRIMIVVHSMSRG